MNRQQLVELIDSAVTKQDRLDEVILFFKRLDDGLPGKWSYSIDEGIVLSCEVDNMEEWDTIGEYCDRTNSEYRIIRSVVGKATGFKDSLQRRLARKRQEMAPEGGK